MSPEPGPARAITRTAVAVVAYAIAMAYVESAVVVYLRAAYGVETGDVLPLRAPVQGDPFAAIEVGREAATLVMLAAVGGLAGRGALERLAWTAVAFGVWDIGYYAWLNVFSGWPPSLGTWDILFLIPVPWSGPVWAPIVVSLALVAFGLLAAARLRSGRRVALSRRHSVGALAGGALVIVSFTIDAGRILAGEVPTTFAWPIFALGMAVAAAATWSAVRAGNVHRREYDGLGDRGADRLAQTAALEDVRRSRQQIRGRPLAGIAGTPGARSPAKWRRDDDIDPLGQQLQRQRR